MYATSESRQSTRVVIQGWGTPDGGHLRARRLARAARFRAGLARHDAAVAHAPAAFFRFLGDVVAFIHVSLLRDVGPVLVILTVVVVAYLASVVAEPAVVYRT